MSYMSLGQFVRGMVRSVAGIVQDDFIKDGLQPEADRDNEEKLKQHMMGLILASYYDEGLERGSAEQLFDWCGLDKSFIKDK